MMKRIFLAFCLFCFCLSAFSQTTMMPIPFSKKGEDKRLIIEDDPCYRIIETKIKNAFLEVANYQLIDYRIALKNLETTDLITNPEKYDIITALVQSASPDIYILVDIENLSKREKSGRQAYTKTINLTAHYTHDGKFLGGTVLNSGARYFDGCYELVEKTFQNKNMKNERKATVFVNQVNEQVKIKKPEPDAVPPHQSISIEFFLGDNTNHNFFSRLTNGDMLFKTLSNWIKEHTVDKLIDPNYDQNYIKFQEVHIPLVNEETKDPYAPSDFMIEFVDFFSEQSFKDMPEKNVNFVPDGAGNTIRFTLQ